jgi:hypothetical protein
MQQSHDGLFVWIGSTVREDAAKARTVSETELEGRAFTMANLGWPKKHAEQRLRKNLAWEYERVGKPAADKRVPALVTAAFKRAGRAKK